MGNYWDDEDFFGEVTCSKRTGSGPHPQEEQEKQDEENSGRTRGTKMQMLLLAVFAGILLAACLQILSALKDYADAREGFEELEEAYVQMEEASDGAVEEGTSLPDDAGSAADEIIRAYYPVETIDHDGLLSGSSDYVGWLYLEDADISYPIMQEPSEEGFYIHADFDGNYSVSGSIYITSEESADFSDRVTIVYGHNMRDGSMFGKLKYLYNDPETLKTPYFFIELPDGTVNVYRIFALAKVQKDSTLYRVPASDENYDTYLEEVRAKASLYNGVCPGLEDRSSIVILSTCYGASGSSSRLMVFGVLQKTQY